MKFVIKHELRGRIRIHVCRSGMDIRQADLLQYYLRMLPGVTDARVYERTPDAVILFAGERAEGLSSALTCGLSCWGWED